MTIPEIEITLKFKGQVTTDQLFTIKSSDDIYDVCKHIFNADTLLYREEFILFCLNKGNKVVGFTKISSGGYDGTVVDLRMIMAIALNSAASAIIIAHNHPSGNLQESKQDLLITDKIRRAGDLMEIKLLDHLIITDSGYMSFADKGLL